MEQLHKVYIALGSNKGDRLKHLQDATDLIFKHIGRVSIIAKVYNTPAFGFDENVSADDFLNTCLLLETQMSADLVMQTLLDIETQMGRIRTASKGYESRTIDLDILFFDENIIDTILLQTPHPELHKRKFVLQPLNDIASKLKHPKLNTTIAELLEVCEDNSTVEPIKIWLKNPSKQYNFSNFNYIAIEGNIGAGKTSLATKISH